MAGNGVEDIATVQDAAAETCIDKSIHKYKTHTKTR